MNYGNEVCSSYFYAPYSIVWGNIVFRFVWFCDCNSAEVVCAMPYIFGMLIVKTTSYYDQAGFHEANFSKIRTFINVHVDQILYSI